MSDLYSSIPRRLRVRGSVQLYGQRVSVPLFACGAATLVISLGMWLAHMSIPVIASVAGITVVTAYLAFEVDVAGRAAPRWLLLWIAMLRAPRVWRLHPTAIALRDEADLVIVPRAVRWHSEDLV